MGGATEYHCCSLSTKLLFFGNKCCFFVWFPIFTWTNVNNHEKTTFRAEKQHFCWNRQQWCYVDFSIIYSTRGTPWWLYSKSGLGGENFGKSRFLTIFENWVWASHMLPWIRLKWYYKLATYWWRPPSQKFLSKFLPSALWDTQFSFVPPIFFTFW